MATLHRAEHIGGHLYLEVSMRKVLAGLTLLTLLTMGSVSVLAEGYGWNNHASPFDFLFGNHIDTHQQSLVAQGGKLEGFFYVRLTGDLTLDGVPVAEHANCNQVPDECTVGWMLNGIPMQARYLGHEHGEHPRWYIDPADLPPQPGYSHFHWLDESAHAGGLIEGQTYHGYLLKLTARNTFFFEHHGGFLVTPGIDQATHANIVTELP
jgi:hypothetical protein